MPRTALTTAVMKGNQTIVDMLLMCGARLDVPPAVRLAAVLVRTGSVSVRAGRRVPPGFVD